MIRNRSVLLAAAVELVIDTGKAYDRNTTDVCNEFHVGSEKIWSDNGASVLRLPPKDRKEFAARVAPPGDKVLGENPRVKNTYEALKASAAKNRRAS